MPRIRRQSRRNKNEYTPHHVATLERGHDHFELFGECGSEAALAAMAEAWELLGDCIMPQFVEANPGRRPWAWWRFDAPEPRRQLLSSEQTGWRAIGDATWFGRPHLYEVCDCHDKREGFPPLESMYETEADYLARHGLLSDEEREALQNSTAAT